MRGTQHKVRLLEGMLNGDRTAVDFHYVSNANQYFVALEKMELIISYWGYKGKARVKYRSITDQDKAREYIETHKLRTA
jgi:hypothetical protein